MQKEKKPLWYVLHTYTSYESKVEKSIRNSIENNGLQEQIVDIVVPEYEDIIEKEDGKRKVITRKKFPSYVFIKMIYSDSLWYLITQTNGVTGFVGPAGRPAPLSEAEIKRLGLEHREVVEDLVVGETVKVINGPLEGHMGTVESVSAERKKVKVVISMFGRETPIELDFEQVEKMIG